MSIVTKTGDLGQTGLMYNRRVSKAHPRVSAYGAVDELNAALGLARVAVAVPGIQAHVQSMQQDLVILMGELATDDADRSRYCADGYQLVDRSLAERLDVLVAELEREAQPQRGWAMPGATASGAALDWARATCRRAERCVCALYESGAAENPAVLVYLNRLSDVLWLLARHVDARAEPGTAR